MCLDKLLILKRSSKVTTMCGMWSAISGTLEKNEIPLERAKMEILEETGLTKNQIKLSKEGTTMNIFDNKYKCYWLIYPFLFYTNIKKIKLNWENSSYLWITPNKLKFFRTVPKLHAVFLNLTTKL
ncbi:MAG: NUDIX domain-containing protein [Thaumarchaeota archaeon]|nr:NUDIX domain-containing protein [Nitrososphaerota archaeon]MCY3975761.1 NUDIX domain-containing protein [Nitrososphaerota archaeon]